VELVELLLVDEDVSDLLAVADSLIDFLAELLLELEALLHVLGRIVDCVDECTLMETCQLLSLVTRQFRFGSIAHYLAQTDRSICTRLSIRFWCNNGH
jgi:hypothetical protein